MKNPEQLLLLQDCYKDKLALMVRHVDGAKVVADYEFNNTYQYIIAREEMHLMWLRDAIRDLGGEAPTAITPLSLPTGKGLALQTDVIADDINKAQAFVDKWKPRQELMTNARHRGMLKVILGEGLEHKRFFEQAKAGREDLLGRRMAGASTGDGVLPVRWVE